MKYKIVIAYDGTNYYGWQAQPDQITLVKQLEKSFYQAFGQKIALVGSSRTDSGVHALGQVAHFETDLALNPQKLLWAWNNILPADITIRSIQVVEQDFHARYCKSYKVYNYIVFTQRPLPLISRFGYYVSKKFDTKILEKALSVFIGTHDFRSFCTGYEKNNTVRTINNITISYIPRYRAYKITVVGSGFLRYMIRRIVGASLDVASWPDRSIDELVKALEEKNPKQHFTTAPACGLILRKIVYKNSI